MTGAKKTLTDKELQQLAALLGMDEETLNAYKEWLSANGFIILLTN